MPTHLQASIQSALQALSPVEGSVADKLAAWDPYDQNASAPYFDPEWMFGLTGFDIVIGNPPYISVERFAGTTTRDKWKENYQTYSARGDIYSLYLLLHASIGS